MKNAEGRARDPHVVTSDIPSEDRTAATVPRNLKCSAGCISLTFKHERELRDHLENVHWLEGDELERAAGGARYQRARHEYERLARAHPVLAHWSFDALDVDDWNRDAIAMVRKFVDCTFDDVVWRVVIAGPVGTGKTALAWAAARHFIEQYLQTGVRFVQTRKLLADIRRHYDDHDEPNPLDDLRGCQLLVLDDLGAERQTEWSVEVLGELIDDCIATERFLVITTNYTMSELAERLGRFDSIAGERIVSRLSEDCIQIRLDGPDRRLGNKAA